jgi:hypothetical protein
MITTYTNYAWLYSRREVIIGTGPEGMSKCKENGVNLQTLYMSMKLQTQPDTIKLLSQI